MTSASVESWSSSFNSKNLIFQFEADNSTILKEISTINESIKIEWDISRLNKNMQFQNIGVQNV